MNRNARRKRQGGFSLVEALAAATLIAVTMMALNMTSISLAPSTTWLLVRMKPSGA